MLTAYLHNDLHGCTVISGGEVRRMSIPQCIEEARGEHVLLVVPGERVLLTAAAVVARSRQRLRQAIPFALEDQLLDDLDELHFATGPSANGRVPVAVVRRSDVRAWLAPFEPAASKVVAMIPDVLMLPWKPGTVTVVGEEERCLMRWGEYAGCVCEPANLPLVLDRLGMGENIPLRCWGPAPEASELQPRLVREGDASVGALMAKHGAAQTIDLLQGEFGTGEDRSGPGRSWRAAAIATLVWLGLNLTYAVVDYGVLARRSQTLAGEIESVFRDTFPEGERMVNPRVQMERALSSLGGSADGAGLLALLEWIGPVLARTPGLAPVALDYREGQLDLDLQAQELPTLERFRQGLEADGRFRVELQSATQGADGVRGVVRISEQR